ncbi:EF0163 family protein [Enterococcus sp. LJL51]|uniref:EF0163 family protein n=1 Tax=Enterococcus sp. LJL51 TaxID=3416656 RepID=UPI003CF877BD
MKKILISLLPVVFIAGGCGKKEEPVTEDSTTESSIVMKKIDDFSTSEKVEHSDTSSSEVESTSEKKEKEEQVDVQELLEDFGKAYASYSTINSRNEKLKDLMTKECAEKNGINSKTDIKSASSGSITNIYKPLNGKSNDYAIQLECKQNGSEVRVLLLVKVDGNKISSMTYNTIKQEY